MDARRRQHKGGDKLISAKQNLKPKQERKAKKDTKSAKKTANSHTLFLLFVLSLVIWFVFGYFASPITALPFEGWEDMPLTGKFEVSNILTDGVNATEIHKHPKIIVMQSARIPNLWITLPVEWSNGSLIHRLPLHAPESIEVDEKGNLYAGLLDGRIVRVLPSSDGAVGMGNVENITDGVLEKAVTTDGSGIGRPMGLRFRSDVLYAMDSVYGFYKVDLKTRKAVVLVSPQDVSPSLKFPNDVDITKNGKYAYFTDSSSLYTHKEVAHIGLLDGTCTGRLFRFEFATKKSHVVAKDFCFNNGIQLSSDEKTVVMAETARSRVVIVDVESGKTVKIVHLPMLPDNIRIGKRGTVWLAGSNVPTFLGKFAVHTPALRQAVAGATPRFLITLSMPFMFHADHNILVEMDQSGEIIRTLHDPAGKLLIGASQVTELDDGRLIIGSYCWPNAAIVNL